MSFSVGYSGVKKISFDIASLFLKIGSFLYKQLKHMNVNFVTTICPSMIYGDIFI